MSQKPSTVDGERGRSWRQWGAGLLWVSGHTSGSGPWAVGQQSLLVRSRWKPHWGRRWGVEGQ